MGRLDRGRQADLAAIDRTLRDPRASPAKRRSARRAKDAILNESKDVRGMRNWIFEQRKQGRHQEVDNAHEDALHHKRFRNKGF